MKCHVSRAFARHRLPCGWAKAAVTRLLQRPAKTRPAGRCGCCSSWAEFLTETPVKRRGQTASSWAVCRYPQALDGEFGSFGTQLAAMYRRLGAPLGRQPPHASANALVEA